jgi:hypothetical protein
MVSSKHVLTTVTLLAAMLAIGAVAPASAALTPNTSIIEYRPGKAFFGTLSSGAYTATGTLSTTGWTDIAVSRDTLLLFRKSDGKLQTALFRDGDFATKGSHTIRGGFTHVAASCDTALFYRPDTGAAMTARVSSGRIRLRSKRTFKMGRGFKLIEASCDTAILVKKGNGEGTVVAKTGTLKEGAFTKVPNTQVFATPTRIAATSDSFLWLDAPDGTGFWGTAVNGTLTPVAGASDFSTIWDIVAGSPDTLYFYDRWQPILGVSYLQSGAYAFLGTLGSFRRNIRLAAAGR